MSNHRLQSSPILGLRYHGLSPGLPSVSKFRSGHMPSGMNVSNVVDNSSESDMDICSDSEDERCGTRYCLEASPQDDKIPDRNGSLNNTRSHHGNILEKQRGRGGNLSAAQRGLVNDESSESISGSEVSSTPSRCTNAAVLDRNYKAGPKDSCSPVQSDDILRQNLYNASPLNKFDDDIPSAPPLNDSSRPVNQVFGAENKPSFATSGGLANENAPSIHKSNPIGANDINDNHVTYSRTSAATSHPVPARYPTYHASGLGYWYSVLSYDACIRLCLHSWARGCMEAPVFLENECALLRDSFGLRHVLLQSEDELLKKESMDFVSEGASVKTKKTIGKIKIQVRKVKMGMDPPTGCTFSSIKSTFAKLETLKLRLSNTKSFVSAQRRALKREHANPIINVDGSLLHQSMAYVIDGTRRFLKEVPQLVKMSFNAWRSSSSTHKVVQESYTCSLRLKSSPEVDAVRMQPGSGETRVFLPDGLGDELVIEVLDSKGKYCGNVVVQVADIADESGEKIRSCFIYHEPEHKQVGKIQLHVNYTTTADENSQKCLSVAETIAYGCVLETAMKVQQFQQRNLLLRGSWKWLVTEFASYFGISEAHTKLKYLAYVMDVATPTADCLDLVHELLLPVVIKGKTKHTLSRQEVRLLGEVSEEIEQILTLVFENFKSLDESSPSGLVDVFGPATGVAAPVLAPALQLYKLLHDILLPEARSKLCRYFQNATKKRSRRHLSETDEFVSKTNDNILMDSVALSTAYKKMKSLCLNIRYEILTDIEIHKQDLLPSFIDLPNLSSLIYSSELYARLRAFLVSCPPPGPTAPVVELVIATADFQRDLSSWNVGHIKDGIDAKELFHVYITRWIQEKRLALLDFCKFDKVKAPSVPTQQSTTSFIDAIYDQLKKTLAEYDVIISRWPEYTFTLENAIADVEKAVLESLEKQYAEVLSPLKENATPVRFCLRYVQRFTKGNACPYSISAELGVLLNSMKRMLDILRPQIEAQVKAWGSCIPEGGNMVPGESLSEVTVMIRSKFRAYIEALIDKLVHNTKLHNSTKLKKIIQDTKQNVIESDIRRRLQPLKELLTRTIDQLHGVFDTRVFVIVCRGFWDRMGQDLLKFLDDKKENKVWYKASRVAVTVLDDTFGTQMQQLLGNALQEKDLEAPRRIMEVRSMLCKDTTIHKDNYYY